MRRFSPLALITKIGLCIILFLFVGELVLLSQHLGEGAELISGSILDGVSIDKSQFISIKDTGRHTILATTKHTISFTIRLTNSTGTNIQAGKITLAFQRHEQSLADPVVTRFDLANGVSKLITVAWKPSIEMDSLSCTMITTVYDAANDQLGTLNEPLNLN